MTRRFRYDNSSNIEATIPLASFRLAECAYRGQVGTGGFDFEDTFTGNLVGLKSFWADELASNQTRFFTGRLADRGIGRGVALRTGTNRQWQVNVVDANALFDDYLLTGADANRPAETDVERVLWLVNDSGFLPGVTDAFVALTDTVNMPARDYRDGSRARNLMDECAELANKNYFLIPDEVGTYLFYDLPDSTAYQAEGSLSSVRSEIDDPDAVLAAIFAPSWKADPALRRDPGRVYSDVEVRWDGGSELVNNPTTESDFRVRQTSLYDSAVKNQAQAILLAQEFLEAASSEEDTLTAPVVLPYTKLGLFPCGSRVVTNFPHLGGSQDYRITKRTIEAWEGAPDRYLAILTLSPVGAVAGSMKITRFGGRPAPGPANPPVPPDGDNDEVEVCDGLSGYPGDWDIAVAGGTPVGGGFANNMTAVGDTITFSPTSAGATTWPDGYGNTATYESSESGFPDGVGASAQLSGRFSVPLMSGANRVITISFEAYNSPSENTIIPLTATLAHGSISGQDIPDNDTYFFKWQVGPAVNRMRIWRTADAEPGTWGITTSAFIALPVVHYAFAIGVADSPTLASQPYTMVMDQLTYCYTAAAPTAYRGASYGPVFVATADGITGAFTLPAYPGTGYVSGSLSVTVDGMWQPVRELDPAAGTFDFGGIYIPDEDDVIYASWRVPT